MKIAAVVLALALVAAFVYMAFALVCGMFAAQREFATRSRRWFERQRFGPAVVVIGAAILAIVFNATFVQLLIIGRLPAAVKPLEGLSSPHAYWFEVVASALLSLVIDFRIVRFIWRIRKNA